MVAVTGSVYSVEEKLAVSQLFRHLDGCTGVLNQLTVLPVLRDGQRVVRVTRDGTLTVPEAALNAEAGTVSAARKTPAVLPPPRPTLTPAPKVDIKEEELHLPVIITPKTNHGPTATPTGNGRGASPVIQATPVSQTKPSAPPAGENKSASVDILAAPKVPASWSRGVITWDTDSPSKSTTLPAPKPAAKESRGVISWESEPPPKPQSSPAVKPPATSSKGVIVWESEPPKSPTPSAASTPASTTVRRTPPMRWESETQTKSTAIAPTPSPAAAPRTPPVAQLPAPSQTTVKPQTRPVSQPSTPPRTAAAIQAPAVPPLPAPRPTNANRETRVVRTSNNPATASEKPALVSPRRWPPAFDIRPPVSEWGQAGSMTFEEEQEPPARPAPRPVARRLEPTDFVPSEPLAPKLAPPEPLIPTPPPQVPIRTPPPSTPVPHQAPTHSRTAWSAWPVSPTDLKQRVESMCGRLAKEVQVQTQRDGSVLVKVKLVNAAAERQLTNKILTIPEITSPNVHLEMVIGN